VSVIQLELCVITLVSVSIGLCNSIELIMLSIVVQFKMCLTTAAIICLQNKSLQLFLEVLNVN